MRTFTLITACVHYENGSYNDAIILSVIRIFQVHSALTQVGDGPSPLCLENKSAAKRC